MIPSRRVAVGILLVLASLSAVTPLNGQVKYPPRAEKLDIQIRYRIRADREERILQFKALTGHLAKLGFVATPREDADLDVLDPNAERFAGTIPSANVLKVLDDPRVYSILFAPAGFTLPEDLAKSIPVRIGLTTTNLSPRDRKPLHQQVLAQLEKLGFREAVGYEHHGYTWVRGSLPAENLNRLLKDLRGEPGGWFAADTPPESLPTPLRDVSPIRWVEVLPDADLTPLAVAPVPENLRKISSDLRAAMTDGRMGPIRIEAVLDRPASELAETVRNKLRGSFSGASVEGVSGFVLALSFEKPADLERFAAEPEVTALRLARTGTETVTPLGAEPGLSSAEALTAMRLDRLQSLGQKGQGVRLIVIGSDFTGADALIGKELPRRTRLIDLTAELTRNVMPLPADMNPGQGTVVARAAASAAPNAELVLVRVSREAFFQLGTIARFVRGDRSYSEAMQSRIVEMSARNQDLEILKAAAVDEYRKAFSDLSDDEKPRERREQAAKALQALIDEERGISAAVRRYSALQESLKAIAGGNIVVVNTLVWEAGFPLDGLSDLSQSIDEFFAGDAMRSPPTRSATRRYTTNAPLWVQAASDSAGSVWGGPFLDTQGNSVMDFAPPRTPLPAGQWSHELNFLGTRAADGKVAYQLAAGTKLRLSVQWREFDDAEVYFPPNPVFPIALRLVRQVDPEGEKRASDELEEVARSVGPAVRLLSESTFAVYEQTLELTLPVDGRYAVRVEGESAFDHRLPALRQNIELHPRLYAEFVPPVADGSRPVFTSFLTPWGGVGIPGDAKSALTVAAIRPAGDKTPELLGGGPGAVLLVKPDLYAPGSLAAGGRGPGIAAGYAAGLSGSLIASGAGSADILRALRLRPGGVAVIPEEWLKWVRPLPATAPAR